MKKHLRFVKRKVTQGINLLPLSSKFIGTPRCSSSSDEYCTKNPQIHVYHLTDEKEVVLPPPVLSNAAHSSVFLSRRKTKPQYILQLKKARVWGQYGAVITADDVFLYDVSREFGLKNPFRDHSVSHNIKLRKPVYVPGTVAVIATAGPNTFYHWMLDILPRLLMLKEAGLLGKVSKFVLNNCDYPYQLQTLQLLNIDSSAIINCFGQRNFHIEAEELLVPTLPSKLNEVNAYECRLLKKYLFKPALHYNGPKRIYITRRVTKTRTVLNEEEVLAYLTQHGFEAIEMESLRIEEQMQLFYSAEIIAGPHGSAFTNIVFSKPETTLLELLPDTYVSSCIYNIAAQMGVRYFGFFGKGIPLDGNNKNDNMEVDLNAFTSFFQKVLS